MTEPKKITHDYECQVCGKPATRNIQECWAEYSIDADGEFSEAEIIEANGENQFLCDECEA